MASSVPITRPIGSLPVEVVSSDLGLTGAFAENERLTGAALWNTGGVGPEDVALDDERRPITGLEDGRIIRFPASGGQPEPIGETGGRPLGIESIPGGGLIISDAGRGLLHMDHGVAEGHGGRSSRFG